MLRASKRWNRTVLWFRRRKQRKFNRPHQPQPLHQHPHQRPQSQCPGPIGLSNRFEYPRL